jgi:hypothetical protein
MTIHRGDWRASGASDALCACTDTHMAGYASHTLLFLIGTRVGRVEREEIRGLCAICG